MSKEIPMKTLATKYIHGR